VSRFGSGSTYPEWQREVAETFPDEPTPRRAAGKLFDPGPAIPKPPPEHPDEQACRGCGHVTHWRWDRRIKQWRCLRCAEPQGWQRGRPATPDEVDNGCELGIAYDPVGGWPA
jgi:hypothetical protein